jgi:hypothetical protein
MLTTIAAFTELTDVASFAVTSRHCASAVKNAENSLGPALVAKCALTLLTLLPMLPNPKPSLLVFFKCHLRAKVASTAPQPARVPRFSVADYYFSYELCWEAGMMKVAWAEQALNAAHFGGESLAFIEMPLDATVAERLSEGDDAKYLQLTVYIIKSCTAEVVKIYDGCNRDMDGATYDYFEPFEFAPCLWTPSQPLRCKSTEVTIEFDAHLIRLCIDVEDATQNQAEFLLELEQGFVFSRCL